LFVRFFIKKTLDFAFWQYYSQKMNESSFIF